MLIVAGNLATTSNTNGSNTNGSNTNGSNTDVYCRGVVTLKDSSGKLPIQTSGGRKFINNSNNKNNKHKNKNKEKNDNHNNNNSNNNTTSVWVVG